MGNFVHRWCQVEGHPDPLIKQVDRGENGNPLRSRAEAEAKKSGVQFRDRK